MLGDLGTVGPGATTCRRWRLVHSVGLERGSGRAVQADSHQGSTELYLSSYARNGRSTYTGECLTELNEDAWGVGVGRRLRNAHGNDEVVYALGISDSHYRRS